MPVIEICQGNGPSLIYGTIVPHKRIFLFGNTIIGSTNICARFSKDKLIVYQNNHVRYRLKETNKWNSTLRFILPICIFFLCCIFLMLLPQYDNFLMFLTVASIIITPGFFNPQYVILENDLEIGFSLETGRKPIKSFSMRNDTYHLYLHSHERYSLFKNEEQIALYRRELEKGRSRYWIYYTPDEPIEMIGLFCLWIDMYYYDDVRGITIIKTTGPPDKHPEYTFWRPKDIVEKIP